MQIEIQARHFPLTKAMRGHVERRLGFALSTRHEHIQRILVRLSDVNGPRGGHDKCCLIQVVLPQLADVIVEEMRRVTREDGKLVFVDYSFPLPHNGAGYLMRFIEFLAGGQHYRSFRRYLVSGGLKGLFAGHGLKQTACTTFKGGSISLVLAANGGQV